MFCTVPLSQSVPYEIISFTTEDGGVWGGWLRFYPVKATVNVVLSERKVMTRNYNDVKIDTIILRN